MAGFEETMAYLWREELLYPAGQESFVQDAADGRPLPRVALEQLRQQRAKFLGVVYGHGGVGAPDDLQNQVLHVASLKLRRVDIQNMSGNSAKFLKKKKKKGKILILRCGEEMKASSSLNIHYLANTEYSLHA